MQTNQTKLFFRHDTFFGICEGIGRDFGFNPNYLRLALSVALLVSPMIVLGIYLGAGVLVAAANLLFPAYRKTQAQAPVQTGVAISSADAAEEDAFAYAQAA